MQVKILPLKLHNVELLIVFTRAKLPRTLSNLSLLSISSLEIEKANNERERGPRIITFKSNLDRERKRRKDDFSSKIGLFSVAYLAELFLGFYITTLV